MKTLSDGAYDIIADVIMTEFDFPTHGAEIKRVNENGVSTGVDEVDIRVHQLVDGCKDATSKTDRNHHV